MRKPTDRFVHQPHSNASPHCLPDAAGAGPDEPAIVIGLATQFAHLGEKGSRLPDPLLHRLRRLAHGGDPAARLMLRMLVGRGKAPRSALRPDHMRMVTRPRQPGRPADEPPGTHLPASPAAARGGTRGRGCRRRRPAASCRTHNRAGAGRRQPPADLRCRPAFRRRRGRPGDARPADAGEGELPQGSPVRRRRVASMVRRRMWVLLRRSRPKRRGASSASSARRQHS